MKIVYMGTPDFAVGPLKAMAEAGADIVGVVTQPDRPKGRGGKVQMSPVKEYAVSRGIDVFQPVKVKAPEAVERLREFGADLFVVAAFGQILSKEILDMPRYGCVNIHASLLPAYRGAAPIQQVLLNGEKETGITLMLMDEGVDTGDILMQRRVAISPEETGQSLHDKLSLAGAELIVEALPLLEEGRLAPVKQEEEKSSYAGMIRKSMGSMDFSRPAVELERLVRALNPWPSAYTTCQGRLLKIWESTVAEEEEGLEQEPGCVAGVERDAILVKTGEGLLRITQVQPEGKKRMSVRDFLLGNPVQEGTRLGE